MMNAQHREKIDSFLARARMALSADQEMAIGAFLRYHEDEKENSVFLLAGAAGTGKTFLIRLLTNFLLSQGYKVALIAPTGCAAKVITRRTRRYASTIHRYIYTPVESSQGSLSFTLKENKDPAKMYYIVDEASMVGDGGDAGGRGLLSDLLKYVFFEESRRKLVMVGDPAQLPPVGSQTSPALDDVYLRQRFGLRISAATMKDVMRQEALSDVLRYATEIREAMEAGTQPVIENIWGGQVQQVDSGYEALEMYTGLFRNDDPDAVVFLTYSNKLAVDVNLAIRRQLFEPTEDLIAGEQVMVVRNNYAWGDKEFPFIANGEMGKVIEVISGSAEEKYGFKWADVIIEFQNLSNNPVEVMCKVVLDLLSDRKPQLSFQDLQQVHRARRAEYEKLPAKPKSESLKNDPYLNALQIKYGYAVTGHKAQGGQWRNVIVAFEPMYKGMSSQDYLRWSYTAVTRAEDRLFMLNFPFGQKDF